MQQLRRNLKRITSLVLVWFALFLSAAVASTVLHPGNTQMVCSAGGSMKMVDMAGDDGDAPVSLSLDCPLCSSMAAPPLHVVAHVEKRSPLAHVLQPIPAAHIAVLTAPPLPSRGPPTVFL